MYDLYNLATSFNLNLEWFTKYLRNNIILMRFFSSDIHDLTVILILMVVEGSVIADLIEIIIVVHTWKAFDLMTAEFNRCRSDQCKGSNLPHELFKYKYIHYLFVSFNEAE